MHQPPNFTNIWQSATCDLTTSNLGALSAIFSLIRSGLLHCYCNQQWRREERGGAATFRDSTLTRLSNFYRAALNAGRRERSIAMRKLPVAVRPSLCASTVKSVNCDKTEQRSVQIFIPYKRSQPSFLRRRMAGGRRPGPRAPSIWNFGSTGPRWIEIADFQSIFTRSASVYHLAKKFN